MFLQRSAQFHSLFPAFHFSILKEPVNQLAARKAALIYNTVLLSLLQD